MSMQQIADLLASRYTLISTSLDDQPPSYTGRWDDIWVDFGVRELVDTIPLLSIQAKIVEGAKPGPELARRLFELMGRFAGLTMSAEADASDGGLWTVYAELNLLGSAASDIVAIEHSIDVVVAAATQFTPLLQREFGGITGLQSVENTLADMRRALEEAGVDMSDRPGPSHATAQAPSQPAAVELDENAGVPLGGVDWESVDRDGGLVRFWTDNHAIEGSVFLSPRSSDAPGLLFLRIGTVPNELSDRTWLVGPGGGGFYTDVADSVDALVVISAVWLATDATSYCYGHASALADAVDVIASTRQNCTPTSPPSRAIDEAAVRMVWPAAALDFVKAAWFNLRNERARLHDVLARHKSEREQIDAEIALLETTGRQQMERVSSWWSQHVQAAGRRLTTDFVGEPHSPTLRLTRWEGTGAALDATGRRAIASIDQALADANREYAVALNKSLLTKGGRLARAAYYCRAAEHAAAAFAHSAKVLRERVVPEMQQRHQQELAVAVAGARSRLRGMQRIAPLIDRFLPPSAAPFDDRSWDEWTPAIAPFAAIRLMDVEFPRDSQLETFADDRTVGEALRLPLVVQTPGSAGFRIPFESATPGQREGAIDAARALLLRLYAGFPPGKLRATFIDPLGLGEAVAPFLDLGDFDPLLVDTKVWTQAGEISEKLAELIDHVELVIQKYLRGRFETIEQYNDEANEVAEPFRFLFVFDFPHGFNEQTAQQLHRLIDNGPRCGVFVIVVDDLSASAPYGVDRDGLLRNLLMAHEIGVEWSPSVLPMAHRGGRQLALPPGEVLYRWVRPPDLQMVTTDPPNLFSRVIRAVGGEGRGADDVVVASSQIDTLMADAHRAGIRTDLPASPVPVVLSNPASWWTAQSTPSIATPIGRAGARDLAMLVLNSETQSGGLLVGRPGSGKSTLLHATVLGLAAAYSPQELEVYLLDFKEGVEFKLYGTEGLPHARCVAVQSEREFGVSVLEAVVAEIERRGELFRSTGGEQSGYVAFRGRNPEPLPRILLVIDEFHELFSVDDRLGSRAGDALEKIVRQGRGFGVHVLLGSQSLAALPALGQHVLRLLPIRIVLPSSESDAHLALGERNEEARFLTRRGEGILNNAGGAPEANQRFQGTLLDDEQRQALLRTLRQRADSEGWTRRPVVFEGFAAADADSIDPNDFVTRMRDGVGARSLRFRVGEPVSLAAPLDIDLRREAGANVLLVARDSDRCARSVIDLAVVSALCATRTSIEIVDFMPIDDGFTEAYADLEDVPLRVHRPRRLPDVLGGLANEVRRRQAEDDYTSPARVLFLIGLHRARDLDLENRDYGAASDEQPDPIEALEFIARNGPELGVHLFAWADTYTALGRRLSRSALREFGHRIGATMGREDSESLFDVQDAASLRPNQVIWSHLDSGRTRRARVYESFAPSWLGQVVRAARRETE